MARQPVQTDGDAAVFVDDVEFMELPEGTFLEGSVGTHMVRLAGFYDCNGLSRYTGGLIFERFVVRSFKNRPLEPRAGDGPGGVNGQGKYGVVKSATQIMYRIPGQSGRPVAEVLHLDPDDVLAASGVVKPRDGIGLRIVEELKLRPESFQVFKCPGRF